MSRGHWFESVPLRLGAFAIVLVVAFVLAFGVGSAVGPVDDAGAPTTAPDPRTGDLPERDGPHGDVHDGAAGGEHGS